MAPAAAERPPSGGGEPAIATALVESARAGELAGVEELVRRLDSVDPRTITGDDARIAFWVNLYNARVLHELAERPRSGSLIRHLRLFGRVGYRVGGREHTLNQMEHGILRLNSRPPYALRRTLRRDDPRLQAAPSRLDPRIHFALNCAARSCPPIQSYEAERAYDQLTLATRAYLEAEVRIDREAGEVTLPYLIKLYAPDFGDRASALDLVAAHLPDADRDWLRSEAGAGARIQFGDYDWTIAG